MFSLSDFLREDTPVGTSFLRAAAHDDDQGSNAAITYSLSRQKPAYLHINPSTGWIYVNHPISQVSSTSAASSCRSTMQCLKVSTLTKLLLLSKVSHFILTNSNKSSLKWAPSCNVLCFDPLQKITDSELDASSNLYSKGYNYNNNTISTFKTHSYNLLHSLNKGLYMVEIICWKKWEKSLSAKLQMGGHHGCTSLCIILCKYMRTNLCIFWI